MRVSIKEVSSFGRKMWEWEVEDAEGRLVAVSGRIYDNKEGCISGFMSLGSIEPDQIDEELARHGYRVVDWETDEDALMIERIPTN